jgi:methionyl-tRNA formyltransferase
VAERSFRALFFGSPPFAVPSLDALHEMASVVAVVCQPDKPAGRGLHVASVAVKERATALGVPIVQPENVRTEDFAEWAQAQRVDVALVVAYGRILPKRVLDAPRLGCVNVHASLLPKLRGAAPVAWAIERGERETGVTLMLLDEGMDSGPTFAKLATSIAPEETAGQLTERLALLGAQAVRTWLPRYVAGRCVLDPQDTSLATLAPRLAKEQGRVDWTAGAQQVHDHVRAMHPWPGAFTTARGHTVKLHATRVIGGQGPKASPGQVLVADTSRILVACGSGTVDLVTVQPEGKRAMRGGEWVVGRGVAEGEVLGQAVGAARMK